MQEVLDVTPIGRRVPNAVHWNVTVVRRMYRNTTDRWLATDSHAFGNKAVRLTATNTTDGGG